MRPKRRHVLPVLALAVGLTGAAPALGADGTRVWMTTGDQQNLLKQQSDASMAGSDAVTAIPCAANTRVAFPVPAPTSSAVRTGRPAYSSTASTSSSG